MKEPFELTEMQRSALGEMGNIGAGHAATALSQLIKKRIDITVPDVNILPLEEVTGIIGDPESVVASVYLRLLGGLTGKIILIFPKESALLLADTVMGKGAGSSKVLDEIDRDALNEVGNILTGSYLGALGRFLGVTLIQSVPSMAFDMVGSIIESLIADITIETDFVLLIETEIIVASSKIKLYFILIPNPDAISAFLDALGVSEP